MERLIRKRQQVSQTVAMAERYDRLGWLAVQDVMTPAPVCVAPDASVLDVVKMVHSHEVRHLLVADSLGRLLGVISDRDLVRCFGPGQYPNHAALAGIAAVEVMSGDLVTTSPETRLVCASSQMLEHGISCLPVLDGGVLVGILTNTDLHVVLELLLNDSADSPAAKSSEAAFSGRSA